MIFKYMTKCLNTDDTYFLIKQSRKCINIEFNIHFHLSELIID